MSRSRGCRRAFTLIELLVVVGIIGVLMAMLLPTLSGARASAYQTRCAANLHALGGATKIYGTEYDDAIVPSFINTPGNHGYNAFDTLLTPMLGVTLQAAETGRWYLSTHIPVMACPVDKTDRILISGTQSLTRSYVMVRGNPLCVSTFGRVNTTSGWTYLTDSGGAADPWPGNDGTGSPFSSYSIVRFSSVAHPAQTLLMTEYFSATNHLGRGEWQSALDRPQGQMGNATSGRNPLAHKDGQFNYLFTDGHVESLLPAQTVQQNASYGSPLDFNNWNTPNYMWSRE